MKQRRPILLLLGMTAFIGCVALPHPTPMDAERAKARWSGASVESLEAGRRAYVARCSGCHSLHLPQTKTPSEWPKALVEMQKEANLAPAERLLIEQFLVTMSEQLH